MQAFYKNGLYCSGGYDWFSISSEGNISKCNALVYRKEGYLGNIFRDDIKISSTEEFTRCPIQQCQQVCDRHWSRKRIYENDILINEQDVVHRLYYKDKKSSTSILWCPSWKCNYNCKYCHLPTAKEFPHIENACKVYKSEEWIKAFNRFIDINNIEGGILHTTGGEPLFYDGIFDIFEMMYHRNFSIALVTNLSVDIHPLIQKIPPEHISDINASLHATDKHFKWDLFRNRVLLLKQFGYKVNIVFVAHPDQIILIPQYHDFFTKKHNIPFNVVPLVGNCSGITFNSINDYPEPLKKILDLYVSKDLRDTNRFNYSDRVDKDHLEQGELIQISVPSIRSKLVDISSIPLPLLDSKELPKMNSIRTIGYINKSSEYIDSSMTQELYKHIQYQQKIGRVGTEFLSEWLLNRRTAIKERNERKIELTCKPLYLDIELNNMCNLKCDFCTCVHGHVRNTNLPAAKLTFDEIDRISELFKYAEIMETSKGGEPFVTPSLFCYMLEKARKLNPCVIIHTVTNGTIMNEDILENIIINRLDHMYISISGDDAERYHKVMGGDMYSKVVKNLQRINKTKESMKSREPFLHFNTQLCKYNDPMKILELAHRYNIIEVNFVKTQMSNGNKRFNGAPIQDYMKKEKIESLMDEIVSFANKLQISINFPGWDTKNRNIIGSSERFYYPYITKYFDLSQTCPTDAPWFRYCTSMRKVQPCCWSGSFDDWTKKPFEEIWNGPHLKNLRRQLSQGEYPSVCHCRY